MKYILLLEQFVSRKEIENNEYLKSLYGTFGLMWSDNFDNIQNVYVLKKKEDILLWISKSFFLLLKENTKELFNSYFNKDQEKFNYYKSIYDNIKGGTLDDKTSKFLKKTIKDHYQDLKLIEDYIFSDIRTNKYKLPLKLKFEKAVELSEMWHNNLKASGIIENETGKKIMTFDDGYYFINLETCNSQDEADAMGHCGKTNANTIVSLRDKNKRPHVTIAIDNDGTIHQIKGKGNTKPIDKYNRYIIEFIIKFASDFENEFRPEEDFQLNDLSDTELLYIKNNNEKLHKSKRFVKTLYKRNLGFNVNDIFNDLYKGEDEKIYAEVDWDEIYLFFNNGNDYDEVSHDKIKRLLNGELVYNDKLRQGIREFKYYWEDITPKTKKQIAKLLTQRDNLKAVYKNNDVYINGVKFVNYENVEETKTYKLILKTLGIMMTENTNEHAKHMIEYTLADFGYYDGKLTVDEELLDEIIEFDNSSYHDTFTDNYIEYLEENEEKLDAKIPYFGFGDDFAFEGEYFEDEFHNSIS